MNCPFYGRYLYRAPATAPTPFMLIEQRGNQCALITDKYAPCHMEKSHLAVDWQKCPIVRDIRIGGEKT